ncbi:MAG: hypothetical protein EA369_00530 [Bradymonadales bacterium]|nr:MAG: hypothetical protein EA369_00530 [Bradymonadales bacterium]
MRLMLAAAFLLAGIGFSIFLVRQDRTESIDPSLKRSFEVAGNVTASADRLLSRVLPVGELDEKEFGEAIKARLRSYPFYDQESDKARYLQKLLDDLMIYKKKDFDYEVFLSPGHFLNAFAMPGGVIVVTEGLLDGLPAEAALIGIMAHELAHVELGHCFSSVKFQLLAKKVKLESLGQLADWVIGGVLRTSFSKTQEAEADDYAFKLMRESRYDPYGLAAGFKALLDAYESRPRRRASDRGVLADYFATHPDLRQRFRTFSSKAELFWRTARSDTRRYRGQQNLKNLIPMSEQEFEGEWLQSFQAELY